MKKIAIGVAGGILLAWLLISSLGAATNVGPSFVGLAEALAADTGFWVFAAVIAAGATYYFVAVKRSHAISFTGESKRLLIAALAIFVPLGLLSIYVKSNGPRPSAVVEPASPAQPAYGWQYETLVDQMSGATTRIARLPAQEGEGSEPAWLVVTERGNVYVEARGATCRTSNGNVTRVRLDDGQIENAQCIRVETSGSDTVELVPTRTDVSTPPPYMPRLSEGRRLVVDVQSYTGDFQAVFQVEGLTF